ncbi:MULTISPECIES: hypothetical protein [unclassified Microbacterium]|uniref:hypothetical protein n=1 Tax=unclassified Microbacterium TaxID=2609290 RepID=UPI000EA8A3DA|nr:MULTISPECIES: hypothetical protein [unclassified Microbacterium]MBT2484569.1 hypothetical protein [Microbacterium sp. ISL-108]RKN67466.1 hypothetical protein D7252_07650 [Microbacterium sp. CGR2]
MDTNEQTQTRSRRRWIAIIAASAIALGGVGIGIALVASNAPAPVAAPTEKPVDDGDADKNASEDPLSTVSTVVEAPLSDDEEAEVERAASAVEAVVAALDEVGKRGDGSAVGVEAVATGWVLGEVQSHAREQFDLGYTQTGDAVVTSVTPTAVHLATEPATITLKVCVDVSGIDIIDAAGNSLKDSLYNPGRPVAHVYGAVFEDDAWKISSHDIPDAQDCAAA